MKRSLPEGGAEQAGAKRPRGEGKDAKESKECAFPPLALEPELKVLCPDDYERLAAEPCPDADPKAGVWAVDPLTDDRVTDRARVLRLRNGPQLRCYDVLSLKRALKGRRVPHTASDADIQEVVAANTDFREPFSRQPLAEAQLRALLRWPVDIPAAVLQTEHKAEVRRQHQEEAQLYSDTLDAALAEHALDTLAELHQAQADQKAPHADLDKPLLFWRAVGRHMDADVLLAALADANPDTFATASVWDVETMLRWRFYEYAKLLLRAEPTLAQIASLTDAIGLNFEQLAERVQQLFPFFHMWQNMPSMRLALERLQADAYPADIGADGRVTDLLFVLVRLKLHDEVPAPDTGALMVLLDRMDAKQLPAVRALAARLAVELWHRYKATLSAPELDALQVTLTQPQQTALATALSAIRLNE